MKLFNKHIILVLISVSCLNTTYASDIESQMKGVSLKSCDSKNDVCLVIKLNQALMSQWTPLFAFKNYELTITKKNHSKNEIIKGNKGYFDLEQNLVVITTEEKHPKEILINLKTLERQEFKL